MSEHVQSSEPLSYWKTNKQAYELRMTHVKTTLAAAIREVEKWKEWANTITKTGKVKGKKKKAKEKILLQ